MDKVLDIWNVVDNTNTEAWCEKLWAGPVMASRFLRGLAVIAMRRKYNGATSGERTKEMVFAYSPPFMVRASYPLTVKVAQRARRGYLWVICGR